MAYNFKNLNEVPMQEKPTENTTVMAFESGQPKQITASEFGGKGLVVDLRGYTLNENAPSENTISDIIYDPIYEAIAAGQNVVFQILWNGLDIFAKPVSSFVAPGRGFVVVMLTMDATLMLGFTNGSYHTTA